MRGRLRVYAALISCHKQNPWDILPMRVACTIVDPAGFEPTTDAV